MKDKRKAQILSLYGKDSKLSEKFEEKKRKPAKDEPEDVPPKDMVLNVLCDLVQQNKRLTEKLSYIYDVLEKDE
jgi:hypothetical protein